MAITFQALYLADDYVEVHVRDSEYKPVGTYTVKYVDGVETLKSYSENLAHNDGPMLVEMMMQAMPIANMEVVVETTNLMSRETVLIPERSKGTCTDPGMERYWSM